MRLPPPPDWTEKEARIWMQGYLLGIGRGEGLAHDLGYAAGQRDELALQSIAAQYADHAGFSAEATAHDLQRKHRRDARDAEGRQPREGDWPGCGQLLLPGAGAWEPDPETAARATALAAELKTLPRVRAGSAPGQHERAGQ